MYTFIIKHKNEQFVHLWTFHMDCNNDGGLSVTQDNQLIEACYTMTLNEKRLLMLGMSRVNPMDFPRKEEPFSFTISAKEWSKYYPDTNPYLHLKRAAKKLRSRFVKLHPKVGVTDEINWFDSVRYIENESSVTLRFTWSIQVRLAGMLEQFTQIDLLAVNRLKSLYSVRLYELLSQFQSFDLGTSGVRIITVEDFRIAMDAVDIYPKLAELKRRILNPALKELNQNSNLEVTFEDIKRGRKITHFKFIFNERQQQKLFR